MAGELTGLIRMVQADHHSHFVVFISDEGFRWRGESQAACEVMRSVLDEYGAEVLPKAELLEKLHGLNEDGTQEVGE